MRIHLLGAKRPLAVTATVALAALGIAAPVAAAPAGDDSDTAVVAPQNTNTEPVTIDFVGITDFHGYIETAPYMMTQIEEIRADNENTLFSSSGDSIGGSAFVSAIAEDVPTLDVLNAMGLDVSAVGNHEFDKGYADLTDRVIPLIDFGYLGANVDGADDINTPPYEIVEIDGVKVAYVGTVTETTPAIVSAGGVEGLEFEDPVVTTNTIAAQLKDDDETNGEADIVVALFHEGDSVAKGLSADVDLVFSGHTHIVTETETDAGAPILQAGQHGSHFAHATLTVGVDGEITVDQTSVVEVPDEEGSVPADPGIQAIVDEAIAESEVLGARVITEIDENAYRGTNNGTDVGANRGTESSMGNHLAEAALFTANTLPGGADFAIINPGGIRNDMDADDNGEVTFQEAFGVSPFGNTIGTVDLTGAQVYEMFEQQFQPTQSRPVLRLGLSDNVTYTYDPTAADGGDITGVWLDGEPIDLDATYTIASNTFLLAGGDNFDVFVDGENFTETGIVDLEGYIAYLEAGHGETIPEGQRSIGIDARLIAGSESDLNLSSLAFTALEDKPETVTLYLNGEEVGTADIDATVTPNIDETGKATVSVDVPADAPAVSELRIVTTFEDGSVDSDVTVPIEVIEVVAEVDFVGITDFHGHIEQAPQMMQMIEDIRDENPNTLFSSSGDSIGGSAFVSAIAQDEPTLEILNAMGLDVSAVGNHEFDKGYDDLVSRVIAGTDDRDGLVFRYLGANVGGADEIADPPYEIFDVDGVKVAYIGTVTADTPSVVSPAGIEGLTFEDPVATTNTIAAQLKDGDESNGEADIVVSLFHEGGNFATGMSENVDLVFSGHTHVVANAETDAGAPILQAGEHGSHIAHATVEFYSDGSSEFVHTDVLPVDGDEDAEILALYEQFKDEAAVLGAVELVKIDENAYRGTNSGTDMGANRGTESSLGNHLAEAALFTANTLPGGADFGIINPGGIRNDMDPDNDGTVTYQEAFDVSPFGNTIGTVDLTGAQVYEMLEQQFQPTQSRPVLRLGLSDNVTYTYDPTAADGGDITGVWLDGELIDLEATYTIASNTFLLAGGDNFDVFVDGENFTETGIVDLEGYIAYLEAGHGETIPEGQRSIGIDARLIAGSESDLNLSSLAFTALEDKPETVTVHLNGEEVGTADIDATVTPNIDETGKATVSVDVPADAPAVSELRIVTTFEDGSVDSDVTVTVEVGTKTAKPEGKWFYVSNDWTNPEGQVEFAFGRVGDEILVGDWDGDSKDTFAVRRGHTFYVTNELKGGKAPIEFKYGKDTDEVLVGDWDGDGKDTFAVRRGHTFYIGNELKGGNADLEIKFGKDTDEAFAGDWDGDGKDTFAVRRGQTFYATDELKGGKAPIEFKYGRQTDDVLVGDWNGDSRDTLGVRRGHTFYLVNALRGGNADLTINYGRSDDDVFVGDWDGDGIDTPAVRR